VVETSGWESVWNHFELMAGFLRTSRSAMAADRAAVVLLCFYQSQVDVQTTFGVYENGALSAGGGWEARGLREFSFFDDGFAEGRID
jgi:hypothetical protein